MIAASIDNLIFFVLIAVAALFQLLSKAVTKTRKSDSNKTPASPTPQTPRPILRAPRESDADRVRKFLEALGQPPSSTPPQPVLPRTDIPPRTVAPVKPPPVLTPAWGLPLERQQKPDVAEKEIRLPIPHGRLQEVDRPPVIPLPQATVITTPLEDLAVSKPFGIVRRAGFQMDLDAWLVSKSRLREAILLREILGTPRGLQELDIM